MSFPTYAAYKGSGIEWLGEVPKHWLLKRVKQIASFAGGGTPDRANLAYWHGDIPWVSPKDMKTELIDDSEEHVTEKGLETSATNLIASNNVLMVVRSGILKHTIPVAINRVPVALNQDMKALRFNPIECLPQFFMRWVQGLNDKLLLAWSKQGATVESIEHSYLAETLVALPPIDEQSVIAAFLDRETSKIDALVQEQQRLIELLKEKRQAVISHAVTKGLNPDAPMKDSGVEWLGEVPEHWEVTRLRYLLRNIKAGPFGSALTKDIYGSEGYRVYGQEQVISGDFGIGDYYIDRQTFVALSQYETIPGDVLISCVGTFGKVAIVPPHAEPGIINPRLIRLRGSNSIEPRYLAEVLRSEIVFEQFSSLSRGGTMDVINIGTLNDVWLCVPPTVEQHYILDFLSAELAKLNGLMREAETAVSLLQERRSALISAAVTGKIDVRGFVSLEAEAA
jgi:type I restriction enzyme S subunit